MTVLLAIPCLQQGGTEIQTLYLAKALHNEGYIVEIVCYFEFDSLVVEDFKREGCKVSLLNLKRSISKWNFFRIMISFYRASGPDVLHVQYMTPGALPIIAAKLSGLKKIFATVHQPYTKNHGLMAFLYLRTSYLFCDCFLSVSMDVELSWFGTSYNFNEGIQKILPKHLTLYNAVDIKRVITLSGFEHARNIKNKYRLSDVFIFGYIGRLSYEKGVDILLEAFGKIAFYRDDVCLMIVGEGSEMAEYEKLYRMEDWWNKIVFAGGQTWESAMNHLSIMDVVVVPSRFEGFGLSAVEAMAAKKTIIAAKTGGLKEIIEHNRNGCLFEPENSEELASLMIALMDDREKCKELAIKALLRAEEFDVSRFMIKIHNLYTMEL
jgi:L-malate glycosyltransferase